MDHKNTFQSVKNKKKIVKIYQPQAENHVFLKININISFKFNGLDPYISVNNYLFFKARLSMKAEFCLDFFIHTNLVRKIDSSWLKMHLKRTLLPNPCVILLCACEGIHPSTRGTAAVSVGYFEQVRVLSIEVL